MTKRAGELQFEQTENPLIWCSSDKTMIKIMITAQLMGKPQMVRVPKEPGKTPNLEDYLDQLPNQLWSQHDTDVGRVLTANPVEVHLKPGCRGPYRQQYPLKQEAIEGVRETIKCCA